MVFQTYKIHATKFLRIYLVKIYFQLLIVRQTLNLHQLVAKRVKVINFVVSQLKEFKNITGHGVLLNTSFNLAGEPLVETPEDAIRTLNNSYLDYIWFEEKGILVY